MSPTPKSGRQFDLIVIGSGAAGGAAMTARATAGDLAAAIHAYPTFAEGIKVAAGAWLSAREHLQQQHEH
jgi:succinate dehydrogenase/fumarate reductase flavoprotein subunit